MSRNKGPVKAKRKRTDREKLELFVSKVDELQNTRLAKIGFNIEHRIQGQQGQPVEFELKQPDEADLKDYLITFRHFISEREDVFLNRIFNICHLELLSEEMKRNLAQARQLFEWVKLHDGASLNIDGSEFTPLQVTDMHLNGKYFHNDLEYQQQLDSMPRFTADVLRFHFLNFVMNVSKIILYVRNVVVHAFHEGLFQFMNADQDLLDMQSAP